MDEELIRETEAARVSELLGLSDEINDQTSLMDQVANGLPVASVENILGMMHSEPILDLIPARAYRRAKHEKQPLSPAKSQMVYDFARTYEVADRIHHGNGALVMQFLEKPNTELGGATPMALAISSPVGADAVIELLNM